MRARGSSTLPLAAPVDLPRLDEVSLDARVLCFALALSGLSGVAAAAWRRAPCELLFGFTDDEPAVADLKNSSRPRRHPLNGFGIRRARKPPRFARVVKPLEPVVASQARKIEGEILNIAAHGYAHVFGGTCVGCSRVFREQSADHSRIQIGANLHDYFVFEVHFRLSSLRSSYRSRK